MYRRANARKWYGSSPFVVARGMRGLGQDDGGDFLAIDQSGQLNQLYPSGGPGENTLLSGGVSPANPGYIITPSGDVVNAATGTQPLLPGNSCSAAGYSAGLCVDTSSGTWTGGPGRSALTPALATSAGLTAAQAAAAVARGATTAAAILNPPPAIVASSNPFANISPTTMLVGVAVLGAVLVLSGKRR